MIYRMRNRRWERWGATGGASLQGACWARDYIGEWVRGGECRWTTERTGPYPRVTDRESHLWSTGFRVGIRSSEPSAKLLLSNLCHSLSLFVTLCQPLSTPSSPVESSDISVSRAYQTSDPPRVTTHA